jgi:hypothetical protein
VAETSDAEDRDPLAGHDPGHLDRLVRRDSGAGQRCGVEGGHRVRDLDHVGRVGHGVLGERAVDGVAAVALLLTQGLPATHAVVAVPAGVAEPRDRDPVAELPVGDTLAQRGDHAHALVSRHERRGRLHRPVAVGGVDVGVTQAAGLHPHQHLARTGLGNRTLLDLQGRIESGDDS